MDDAASLVFLSLAGEHPDQSLEYWLVPAFSPRGNEEIRLRRPVLMIVQHSQSSPCHSGRIILHAGYVCQQRRVSSEAII